MLRGAIRRRNPIALFVILTWSSVLTMGLAFWVAIYIDPQPDAPLPWLMIANKWVAAFTVSTYGFVRFVKSVRLYRRRLGNRRNGRL